MSRTVTPLKIAIVASGLTHRELAERIGRHPDEISKWATGRLAPTRATRIALAHALDSTVEALFPVPVESEERAA